MEATSGRRNWIGPWLIGLGVTLAIMIGIELLLGASDSWWVGLIVLGATSLWVVWDSSRIQLREYRTQLANEPAMLLFLCFVFWVPVFPWYLIVRQGIRRGLVPRKGRISRQARR